MIKKFKCIACGKKFDADDKDAIVCPKCHSDNVTPVKPDFVKPIGFALVLIVSVGVGMLVTKQCKNIEKETAHEETMVESGTISDSIVIKHEISPELLKTVEIQNTKPVYDKASKSYSLNVIAKNVPEYAKVSYELCKEYDPKNHIKIVLMTSEDGRFEKVPASKNECSTYFVIASVYGSDGQILTSRDREIDGFEEVKTVTARITKAQLQNMINNRASELQGKNPKISNRVVILVNGDDVNKVQTFQDIFLNVKFDIWRSVSVVSVEYDHENRVSKVVLSVIRSE